MASALGDILYTTTVYDSSEVDNLISAATSNLDIKDSVVTASLVNITLSGEQTINGVLTSSSRVGVVGQTNSEDNGIYTTGAGAWVRTSDADTDAEVTNGLSFFVGDTNSTLSGNQYILVTPDPITLGVTPLTFAEIPKISIASVAETNTGTENGKAISPLGLEGSKYLDQSLAKIAATASGTNTYTATISPAITSYVANQVFNITFTNANTGASTINLNGLGAKALTKNATTALANNDISAGQMYMIQHPDLLLPQRDTRTIMVTWFRRFGLAAIALAFVSAATFAGARLTNEDAVALLTATAETPPDHMAGNTKGVGWGVGSKPTTKTPGSKAPYRPVAK